MIHGGEVHSYSHIKYDFSVNINPLGVPEGVVAAVKNGLEKMECYPDQECRALRSALSMRLKVSEDEILCGNGASELILLMAEALRPGKTLLTAPSFLGYAHALNATGSEIQYFPLKAENGFKLTEDYLSYLNSDIELAILCSPSNPVGNTIDSGLLKDIAASCAEKGIYLLCDQCFAGFLADEDGCSAIHFIRDEGISRYLLVLDAFTKRYAMPGIRLGYAVSGNKWLLSRMKSLQTEWSVSSLAQVAGLAALRTPESYMIETLSLLGTERKFLSEELQGLGIKVYTGDANYIFFETEKQIFKPLFDRGILIRHCDNYVGLSDEHYRVAIKKHEDNEVLVSELKRIMY